MFYDEIIYLFLALILWGAWPREAGPPLLPTVAVFLLKDLFWVLLVRRWLAGAVDALSFTLRQRALLKAALIFFFLDVAFLKLPAHLPGELWALLLYGHYLLLAWYLAGRYERRLHLADLSPGRYLLSQVRFFLPALVPWVLASAGLDLVRKILPPLPEYLLWLTLLGLLGLLFPYLAVRLWPTKPLPPSSLRARIEEYLEREGVRLGGIHLWLPFEGRLLTAGVLGVIPPLRYLLISPGLLATLEEEETLAVVAHEAGHIKHRHLWWLFFFLVAFLGLLYWVLEPIWLLLISFFPYPELFISQDFKLRVWPEIALALLLGGLVVLYFRYFVGYFLRNFERQADLYALESLGSARGLIAALEKIAALSGLRKAPSWHHYSLDERIAFLHAASLNPTLAARHHARLARRKWAFVLLFLGLTGLAMSGDHAFLKKRAFQNIVRGLEQRAREEPEILRALGDYLLSRGFEREALRIYERVLLLAPEDPWTLNNLAWLLLTAKEPSLRQPSRALELAEKAAERASSPAILDTLAEAYLQNNRPEEACRAVLEALRLARKKKSRNLDYYQKRRKNFCAHVETTL